MTFSNMTQADAVRIRDVLNQLAQKEADAAKVIHNAVIQVAIDWWDSIKPEVPTTRDKAITSYNFIKELLETETDRFRLSLLRKKLDEANEKFKEIKRNG